MQGPAWARTANPLAAADGVIIQRGRPGTRPSLSFLPDFLAALQFLRGFCKTAQARAPPPPPSTRVFRPVSAQLAELELWHMRCLRRERFVKEPYAETTLRRCRAFDRPAVCRHRECRGDLADVGSQRGVHGDGVPGASRQHAGRHRPDGGHRQPDLVDVRVGSCRQDVLLSRPGVQRCRREESPVERGLRRGSGSDQRAAVRQFRYAHQQRIGTDRDPSRSPVGRSTTTA